MSGLAVKGEQQLNQTRYKILWPHSFCFIFLCLLLFAAQINKNAVSGSAVKGEEQQPPTTQDFKASQHLLSMLRVLVFSCMDGQEYCITAAHRPGT